MISSAVSFLLLLLVPGVSAAPFPAVYITLIILVLLMVLAVVCVRLADRYHLWEQINGLKFFAQYEEDDGKFEMRAFGGHGYNDNERDGEPEDDLVRGETQWNYKKLENDQELTLTLPAMHARPPPAGSQPPPPSLAAVMSPRLKKPIVPPAPQAREDQVVSPRAKRAMSPPPKAKEERLMSPRLKKAMIPPAPQAKEERLMSPRLKKAMIPPAPPDREDQVVLRAKRTMSPPPKAKEERLMSPRLKKAMIPPAPPAREDQVVMRPPKEDRDAERLRSPIVARTPKQADPILFPMPPSEKRRDRLARTVSTQSTGSDHSTQPPTPVHVQPGAFHMQPAAYPAAMPAYGYPAVQPQYHYAPMPAMQAQVPYHYAPAPMPAYHYPPAAYTAYHPAAAPHPGSAPPQYPATHQPQPGYPPHIPPKPASNITRI